MNERPAQNDVLAKVLHDNGTCDTMFAHYGQAKKCERLAEAIIATGVLDAPTERGLPPRALPARFGSCQSCAQRVLMIYRTEADPAGRPVLHECVLPPAKTGGDR